MSDHAKPSWPTLRTGELAARAIHLEYDMRNGGGLSHPVLGDPLNRFLLASQNGQKPPVSESQES
jgi:hypothetical protein